jgi:hypothetical protein
MTFHNNLNYKFIAAMNKEATIYQAGNSGDIEKVPVSDEQCAKSIEAALTSEAAIVAYMECIAAPLRKEDSQIPAPLLENKKPEVVTVEENKIRAEMDGQSFVNLMRSILGLERVLTRSFAGWMAEAFTEITGGVGGLYNSGNWAMFINILCSNAFRNFWESIGDILDRYTWLNRYWSTRYKDAVKGLGTAIANAMASVLTNWGVIPSAGASFEAQLARFISKQIEALANTMHIDPIANICNTITELDSAFNAMGATAEEREKALAELWDAVSDYIITSGGIILNTMGGARNVISEFAASVSNFIANNQEEITIGVLLALAIAVAVAGGIASGGIAAPALAAALLAFAAILGVDLEGYTQESIQEALERGSV